MATERTVYILDDDAAVLRSLERLLSSANFKPVTFDHPDVFLTAATTFKTGCVLLDVRLPGMSGLDVQAQLLKMRNDLAVIVVTGQGDIQTAVRAMKAGAADFLEKPYSDHALLGSIEATFGKENRPDRDRDIAEAVRRIAGLTPRERDVLDGLVRRLATRQQSEQKFDLTAIASGDHRAFPVAVFQGAPVQELDRSLAGQGNDAAVLQICDGTAHRLDRDREIVGDVVARDRQFDLLPGI